MQPSIHLKTNIHNQMLVSAFTNPKSRRESQNIKITYRHFTY